MILVKVDILDKTRLGVPNTFLILWSNSRPCVIILYLCTQGSELFLDLKQVLDSSLYSSAFWVFEKLLWLMFKILDL